MGANRIARSDAPVGRPSIAHLGVDDPDASGIPVPATAEGFAVSIGKKLSYTVKVPATVTGYRIK